LFQNLTAKAETEFWLLDQDKVSVFFFYLLILFLPTQLGKHFLTDFSFVKGLRIDYLSPTLYFTDVLILGIFLFSFKKTIKELVKKHAKKLLVSQLIFLFLIVGIINSINYQAGLYIFIKLIEYVYLGIFTVINFKQINKQILLFLFGAGILFESSLAFFQYLNRGSFQGLFYFLGERAFNGQTPGIANASINGSLILRPYATFAHPNVLAGYLNLALIFFLYFGKKANARLKLVVIIFALVGIFISFSRAGILALVLNLFIYFCITIFEKYKKGKSNPRYLVFLLVTISSLVFLLLFAQGNSLIAQRFSGLKLSDESVLQRSFFIQQAVEMFLKNPVFGVGLGNYINNLGRTFISHDQLQPVHNILLLILAETGIFGLGIFILILIKFLLRIKNVYCLLFFFSLVMLGSFDHYLPTLQQGQILITLVISAVMSESE